MYNVSLKYVREGKRKLGRFKHAEDIVLNKMRLHGSDSGKQRNQIFQFRKT